jgi:TolB protein
MLRYPSCETYLTLPKVLERYGRRTAAAAVIAAIALSGPAQATVTQTSDNRSNSGQAGSRLPYGLSVADTAVFSGRGDLAFVSRGQLLVLDGATGKIRDLGTEHVGDYTAPKFSPYGRWVAYNLGRGSEWVARADGTGAREVAHQGTPEWLPNGLLVAGKELVSLSPKGSLRNAGSAAGLVAWAPDGKEYVFLQTGPTVTKGSTSETPWRLEVASSPGGPRTTWYRTTISVDKSGTHGNYITRAFALPGKQGLLVEVDRDDADDADGQPIYEIRSPGAPLVQLGYMLAPTAGGVVTFGPGATFALGAGPDRYAWMTKSALICQAATERCRALPTTRGTLTLDPAWSPNGKALAFVEAPSSNAGSFYPSQVIAWYATHHLFLLKGNYSAIAEIPGTKGASAPVWSLDSKSLLYVSGDGLWLLPGLDKTPVEIAAPLFEPPWPSYYGQVDWPDQFAWSAGVARQM